jgi:arginase
LIGLIGVPTNTAGKTDGVAKAPAVLRRAGLVEALRRSCDVRDDGDVSFLRPTEGRDSESGIIAYPSQASMVRNVRKKVHRALLEGRFPLVIGGDCPILLGCLAASREVLSTGLVFVDGHEDAYPPHRSPTGEAADMELGFALGLETPMLIGRAMGSEPVVYPSQVCILGPRDREILQRAGIRSLDDGRIPFYDADALRGGSLRALVRRAIGQLASKAGALWFHVDLDVLSTRSLPAVDYPQPGGLSWGQLEGLTDAVLSSGHAAGMDVTIYNPDLDLERRSARRIVRYLQTAMASIR